MAKEYVARQSAVSSLSTRVTELENNPEPGPPGPPGDDAMANIYVQQTDPGAVPVNSIWFETDSGGDIIAMNVMVP